MSDVYEGMPKKLKIGCFQFRIEVTDAEDSESDGEFGHMNPINQKIRLRPGMTAQNLADTFIHEVLHAIHWHASLHDGSIEEEFTLLSAHGLCSLWQDNPKQMAWWVNLNALGLKNG